MDFAGHPAGKRATHALAAAVILLTICASWSEAQVSPLRSPSLHSEVRQLFEQERWREIVDRLGSGPLSDPDLVFYYGSALAQLGRWEEAQRAFQAGRHLAARDPRFPVELAGVAFKRKRLPEAARWLRCALRLDPTDRYANDFLGTVYFLEGNLDAALKYWNRIGKPEIQAVRPGNALKIQPSLLDHALAFAPASTLRLPDLLTSRTRVEGLGVFASPKFQLAARQDGKFDIDLNLQERDGWGSGKWEALLSLLRGVGYETVYPEYFNLGRNAVNVTSLLRWDAQKYRAAVELSGPLQQNPKWRYQLGLDFRRENWALRNGVTGSAESLGALTMRREAADAEVTVFPSGRWGWSAGVEVSHRDYGNIAAGSQLNPQWLLGGMQLKQLARIHGELLRSPEHRLVIDSGASWQLARIWSQPSHTFAKLQGFLRTQWFPQAQGDDYETNIRVRSGGTAGQSPFDELYILGLERDNDLWMRAHVGTRNGRKGSAPLGRQYVLLNSEMDKNVYGNGLLKIKLGPFLDSGRITDSFSSPGGQKQLWDTGLQAKLKVLGVGLTFIWGKDLRTGGNAYYFTAGR